LGNVVEPAEDFDATDAVRFNPPRFRRFAFAWFLNGRWLVATEKGGFAYNNPEFLFGGEPLKLIHEETAFRQTLCSTAEKLLAS
jgi:hypothetical protein